MEIFFIAGFIGGILRGVVGLVKYSTSYKDVEIRPWYFFGTIVATGFIGLITAWIVQDLGIQFLGLETLTPALAVVIGYAGGDLLENIYKMLSNKSTIF